MTFPLPVWILKRAPGRAARWDEAGAVAKCDEDGGGSVRASGRRTARTVPLGGNTGRGAGRVLRGGVGNGNGLPDTATGRQDAQVRQPRREIPFVEAGSRLPRNGSQRFREIAGALKARIRLARQRGPQRGQQLRCELRAVTLEHAQVGLENPRQDVELVSARKQRPAEQHLGEHDADGEQIAARVELAADHLLRRHVAHLAFELSGIRPAVDEARAHDAEVGELHLPRAADENVARRYVAVHDAKRPSELVQRLVREGQRAQHLVRDEQGTRQRKSLAARRHGAEQLGAGDAIDILHGHEQVAVALAEIDDLDDVRVGQRSTDTRLVAEHLHEARVLRELRQDELDREALVEAVRTRACGHVDLGHAARTETLAQLV